MIRMTLTLTAIATLVTSLAHAAGSEKPPKPLVCVDFREAVIGASKLGACFDGKKPVVWVSWTTVTIEDHEGNPRRVTVGYR